MGRGIEVRDLRGKSGNEGRKRAKERKRGLMGRRESGDVKREDGRGMNE